LYLDRARTPQSGALYKEFGGFFAEAGAVLFASAECTENKMRNCRLTQKIQDSGFSDERSLGERTNEAGKSLWLDRLSFVSEKKIQDEPLNAHHLIRSHKASFFVRKRNMGWLFFILLFPQGVRKHVVSRQTKVYSTVLPLSLFMSGAKGFCVYAKI